VGGGAKVGESWRFEFPVAAARNSGSPRNRYGWICSFIR
jgi:hypothetical protein